MGCLKGIFRLIVIAVVIAGFFYLDGPGFIKEKIDGYTSPEREIFVQEEKDFGNLSSVPYDYKFQRSITLGKYRKILATHTPSGQKISLIDIGDTTTLNQADFYTTKIDLKLYQLMDTVKNSPLEVKDVEITQRGTVLAKGKIVPYVNFTAKLKIMPLIKVAGTIAAYNTKNTDDGIVAKISKAVKQNKEDTTTKIVLSTKLSGNYSFEITETLIKAISFIGL